MRLASGKFKHLASVQKLLPMGTVPPFCRIDHPEELPLWDGRSILRSALHNEAQNDQLLSGKSLSIGGIDSSTKLSVAWELVSAQANLTEVILQKEISWETHVTLFYESDFFFAELKQTSLQRQFLYWTPLARSLNPEMGKIKDMLTPLKGYLMQEKCWLMEAGISGGKLFLFQIQPVNQDFLGTIFTTDLIKKMVLSRERFTKNQSFWGLMKTEWKAMQFRKKMLHEKDRTSHLFVNWEFLFHYFRLFCMMKKFTPDAQSFAAFLAMSFQKQWPSSLIKQHLTWANILRQDETFDPMDLGFDQQGLIFIGKGIVSGVVGEGVQICESISLEQIYQNSKPRVILTKEVGLLSHPVLASVENGIYLVLGVHDLPREGETIYLDFDQKILRIE